VDQDWDRLVSDLAGVKRAIELADRDRIYPHEPPPAGATAAEIAAAEEHLGCGLDPEHARFLTAVNGWTGFFQATTLLGTRELCGGQLLHAAYEALGFLEPNVLQDAGIDEDGVVPVAVNPDDLDLFVMPVNSGRAGPSVVWLAGYVVERFSTFEDYVFAMVELSRRELKALTS
jgi:hypothetical protein